MKVTAPVLLIVTVPPATSLIPVTVSGLAVLVRSMSPLVVLVALKVLTVFALLSVVPPTELVVRVPVVFTIAVDCSAIAPPEVPVEVRLTFPLTVEIAAPFVPRKIPMVVFVPTYPLTFSVVVVGELISPKSYTP